jgi:hypothetical protein
MAETLLTSSKITREVMMVLSEKLTFLKKINRQYDDSYRCDGAKAGDTLKIRVPSNGVVRQGRVMDLQEKQDRTVSLTIGNQWGIDLGASSADMTLKIDDFRERYIEPKVATLAAQIEAAVLSNHVKAVPAAAGDYGAYDDFDTVLHANQLLSDQLAPQAGRIMLVSNKAERKAVDAFKALFNSQKEIGRQYEEGSMGRCGGFDWYSSGLIPSITRGSANTAYETATSGAALTSDTTTNISTIAIDTGTGTFVVGDVFTIEGVNAVHPQTKADLGYLKQFTVTTASAGGTVTLSFSPAIVVSGPEQNVTATPGADKDVLPLGTASVGHQHNIAFSRDAFAFVTADLPLPKGKDASRMVHQGISLRYINDYDTVNDMFISRVDVLWGSALLRPELAVRVPSLA